MAETRTLLPAKIAYEYFLFLSHNMKIANRKMLKSVNSIAFLIFKQTAKR
ncbi:hypothetical protein ATW7_11581 [Alteromonadales bacterium TW-7]|nr:hypothetical protein ATW7_11581 [Alteromonadales bacterium TW-7]